MIENIFHKLRTNSMKTLCYLIDKNTIIIVFNSFELLKLFL